MSASSVATARRLAVTKNDIILWMCPNSLGVPQVMTVMTSSVLVGNGGRICASVGVLAGVGGIGPIPVVIAGMRYWLAGPF